MWISINVIFPWPIDKLRRPLLEYLIILMKYDKNSAHYVPVMWLVEVAGRRGMREGKRGHGNGLDI